jgi:hypothetical protein
MYRRRKTPATMTKLILIMTENYRNPRRKAIRRDPRRPRQTTLDSGNNLPATDLLENQFQT